MRTTKPGAPYSPVSALVASAPDFAAGLAAFADRLSSLADEVIEYVEAAVEPDYERCASAGVAPLTAEAGREVLVQELRKVTDLDLLAVRTVHAAGRRNRVGVLTALADIVRANQPRGR